MTTLSFIEQAKQTAAAVLRAYFIENNMDKVQACFAQQQHTSFIGWGRQEVFCGYSNIFHTIATRINEIQRSRLDNLQLYVPYAADGRCIVLLTCHIATELQTGYNLDVDCRFSYVIINEDGAAKILQLTVSVPNATKNSPAIASKRQHITARLASSAADYSPNGLKCCQLDAEYTASYVNKALAQLAGWQTPQELLQATQGKLHNLADARDLDKLRQTMQSLVADGDTYTVNYRLRIKQNGYIWVLERGRRTTGTDGRPCIICAASPLLQSAREEAGCSWPQLNAPSYEIPTEAFLKISLDIACNNGRSEAVQQLLQLTSDLLQLEGICVTDIRQSALPMHLATYYDTSGTPPSELFLAQTGDETMQFFNTQGFAQCGDTSLLPDKYRPAFALHGIRSFCQQIVSSGGERAYIATFYKRTSIHSFTAHEQEIITMTAQVIGLLLNDAFMSEG